MIIVFNNISNRSHNNVLSVALGSSVYLWSACTSKVTRLCDLGDDAVTSISWALSGNHISIGTNSGKIQIWDCTSCKMTRELQGHESRVGTMAWNSTLLASGSRDRNILVQDIRIRSSYNNIGSSSSSLNSSTNSNFSPNRINNLNRYSTGNIRSSGVSGTSFGRQVTNEIFTNIATAAESDGIILNTSSLSHNTPYINNNSNISTSNSYSNSTAIAPPSVVREFSAHKQEVCGLKWSFDEKMLASGGNGISLTILTIKSISLFSII